MTSTSRFNPTDQPPTLTGQGSSWQRCHRALASGTHGRFKIAIRQC